MCPGYSAFRCFGFLKTFLRFDGITLPKWEIFFGNSRSPPISLMSLPMVEAVGQVRFLSTQKGRRGGKIFSFPRFGCSSRIRRISSRMRRFHIRFRLVFGVRFFSERASIFFPPSKKFFFQRKRVLLLVFGNASRVVLNPCFSQNARTRALSSACSVIIYWYLKASS